MGSISSGSHACRVLQANECYKGGCYNEVAVHSEQRKS